MSVSYAPVFFMPRYLRYVCGDQSHNGYEAEENAQSNGKRGANHLDEVVVLEKQTCQFPDHCSQQGGDNFGQWSLHVDQHL